LSVNSIARMCELALRYRMPSIGESSNQAKAGLLVTYGQDPSRALVRVAEYIDKTLRGAKPGELPVEQASKFELAINLKTAKAIGLTIPESFLLRADEVLE
jgi:putative ABC transport system substrate-binding protein